MTNILITGGAGSLGTALIDQIFNGDDIPDEFRDSKVRVLDSNEHSLAKIKNKSVRKLYGNISDKDRIMRAMKDVDIVIHCAAMKNLEITEYNTSELIKTNVVGTDNVISAAVEYEVRKVMFISSDKAVEPISIYGASKLIGEHVAMNYNNTQSHTKVSVFRSGNFLDSNGNVFEVWREQKKNNIPITITDTKCRRYFILTEHAAKLILKCISCMEGGEIFIPDGSYMNERSIGDMLESAGINIHEHEIKFIGLRKGERIAEFLMSDEESKKHEHHYEDVGCTVLK